MQNEKKLTYVRKASGKDMSKVTWAISFPVVTFFLTLLVVYIFKTFGRRLIAPMAGIMWIVGAVVALIMPSQRKEIINTTLITISGYCAGLLTIRELIAFSAGASAQMLMATFGEAITTAAGNTVPGFLQNNLYITAVFVPLTFLGMQGKRFVQFQRNRRKADVINNLRRVHDSR